ncbi:MAG TPA: FliH/SctL family protein [Bdellovibrionales bacterium]|nr:FliH/SctL family protein [Bdellovibrionales bacterium]
MSNRKVFKKEEAENLVLEFTPKALDAQIPAVARDFLSENQKRPKSFRLNELVAQQTGISEIERLSLQEKIEARALEKVREIQENAYREAYNLGLEEGRKRAFDEEKDHLLERLGQFDRILTSISHIKTELAIQNEAHIVRLAFELAKKLFFEQLQERPDRILPVLRQAIDLAQSEESVLVRLSEQDHKYIEEFRTKLSKEFDFIKRMKFESSPDIHDGGAVLETNYGVVDATIEERVDKLWSILKEKAPKVKGSSQT